MRRLFTALAGAALSLVMATGAFAQSFPFSFSGPSSLLGAPDRLTFGLTRSICSDCRAIAGSSGPEDILIRNPFGLFLAATWLSAAASSSAPALAYTLGVEHEDNNVEAFRYYGGVSPTNGSSTFTGLFVGVAYETPFGGGFSSSSIAVPTFGFGLNLGYGWAGVDGFNGSFRARDSGLYGRADAYMAIPMAGGILLSPGISYRVFDFGSIEDAGLAAFLRLTIPL